MTGLIEGIIVLLLICILLIIFLAVLRKGETRLSYRLKSPLLGYKEYDDYKKILSNLPKGYLLFAKVRMLDAVVPANRNDFKALGKISSKKLDFLVTDSKTNPVAVYTKSEPIRRICSEVGLESAGKISDLISIVKRKAYHTQNQQ